jgi:hypothetical protein
MNQIAAAQTNHYLHQRATGHQRRFARHFGVMLLLMFAGMAVLGGVVELMLLPFGQSMNDASAPVTASVMAVTMTVPMVAWMHFKHRMPVARSIEMTASMVVPSLLAIALYAVATISSESVLVVQHAVMIPAMLGVMLWRYDAYAH